MNERSRGLVTEQAHRKRGNPKVLVTVTYYLPGFRAGGPVRSVSGLVDRLGEILDFSIVTSDRDLGQERSFPNLVPNTWTRVGKGRVMYVRGGVGRLATLCRVLRRESYDVVYLNSAFSPTFSLGLLLMHRLGIVPRRPLLLAPRGEFSPGALQIHAWRKRLCLLTARVIGLYREVLWHATAKEEREDVLRERRALSIESESQVLVAGPVVCEEAPGQGGTWVPKEAGRLRVVFISRISQKKNLIGALAALSGLSGRVAFSVFGPIEDEGYWRRCERAMTNLPANVAARYEGSLEPRCVERVFRENDLFLFPTHGENFGHVILESLLSGCPVLTSTATPWTGLAAAGVGWTLRPDDVSGQQSVLEECVRSGAEEWEARRIRAKAYGMRCLHDEDAVEANLQLFARAAGG